MIVALSNLKHFITIALDIKNTSLEKPIDQIKHMELRFVGIQ